jgi:hypothetical protein
LSEVRGSNRIAVTCGSRERRKITVGNHRFGQDLSSAVEQFDKVLAARAQPGCMFFHQVARFFEGQN